MTMLSAQPITLTGEQHQRIWSVAADVRRLAAALEEPSTSANEYCGIALASVPDEIERILIDAQDAAPPATASSGEAA